MHHYDGAMYEEYLEIKAVCTSEEKANEICDKLNNEYSYKNFSYVEIESNIEFDDEILRW